MYFQRVLYGKENSTPNVGAFTRGFKVTTEQKGREVIHTIHLFKSFCIAKRPELIPNTQGKYQAQWYKQIIPI